MGDIIEAMIDLLTTRAHWAVKLIGLLILGGLLTLAYYYIGW